MALRVQSGRAMVGEAISQSELRGNAIKIIHCHIGLLLTIVFCVCVDSLGDTVCLFVGPIEETGLAGAVSSRTVPSILSVPLAPGCAPPPWVALDLRGVFDLFGGDCAGTGEFLGTLS